MSVGLGRQVQEDGPIHVKQDYAGFGKSGWSKSNICGPDEESTLKWWETMEETQAKKCYNHIHISKMATLEVEHMKTRNREDQTEAVGKKRSWGSIYIKGI